MRLSNDKPMSVATAGRRARASKVPAGNVCPPRPEAALNVAANAPDLLHRICTVLGAVVRGLSVSSYYSNLSRTNSRKSCLFLRREWGVRGDRPRAAQSGVFS